LLEIRQGIQSIEVYVMEMCSDKVSGHFARRCFVASAGLATGGLCAFGLPAMADAAGQNSMGGDLDAFIRSRMELAHVPGLSLAIIHDGRLLRAVGFGFANLTHQRSMRADTLINVGSVTKTNDLHCRDAAVGAKEVRTG
jgi:hypothetical protein